MNEQSSEENKIERIKKVTALYIDDHKPTVEFLKIALDNDTRFAFVECHSTEEALKAIYENNPSILFLDNSLAGGDEGLEVVDEIKKRGDMYKMNIVSTTSNLGVKSEYEKRGITTRIDKDDYQKIKSIVENFKKEEKK